MKTSISVIRNIKRLIKQLGSVQAVADKLKQSERYIEMLRDGKKKASWALAELIRAKLGG